MVGRVSSSRLVAEEVMGGFGDELNEQICALERAMDAFCEGLTASIKVTNRDCPNFELFWCRSPYDSQRHLMCKEEGSEKVIHLLDANRHVRVVASTMLSNLWDEIERRKAEVEKSVAAATKCVSDLRDRVLRCGVD